MNQTQAFNAAAKLLGVPVTKVGMRLDKTALTGDDRQSAIEAQRAAVAVAKAAKEARDARRLAILAADPEYQALKQSAFDAEAYAEALRGKAWGRRVVVLRTGGIFNEVVAEGDNFADAIDELKRKRAA